MIDKNTHARPKNDDQEVEEMSFHKIYHMLLINYVSFQLKICANTHKTDIRQTKHINLIKMIERSISL